MTRKEKVKKTQLKNCHNILQLVISEW